jgi:hypothetical protein
MVSVWRSNSSPTQRCKERETSVSMSAVCSLTAAAQTWGNAPAILRRLRMWRSAVADTLSRHTSASSGLVGLEGTGLRRCSDCPASAAHAARRMASARASRSSGRKGKVFGYQAARALVVLAGGVSQHDVAHAEEVSCAALAAKNFALQTFRLARSAGPRNRSTSAAAALQSIDTIFSSSLATTH